MPKQRIADLAPSIPVIVSAFGVCAGRQCSAGSNAAMSLIFILTYGVHNAVVVQLDGTYADQKNLKVFTNSATRCERCVSPDLPLNEAFFPPTSFNVTICFLISPSL